MTRHKFYINVEEKKNHIEIDKSPQWKTALYIRLSREDGDKAESDSVVNQRKLLANYVTEHEEFSASELFIDEDFTGTNFNRPAFLRMVNLIKRGGINCVIVKDLSRFGRDYIGAGKYLEHVFPQYNCRFISILDDLDSYVNPDQITGLMVRVKSLIHDQNSQDISKKVRATKNMLRKEGKYIAAHVPYGYKKDPNDKHHLIIDETVAPIVRNIYDWYLSGMGVVRIAQKLNHLSINTSSNYKKTNEVYKDNGIDSKGWSPRTVRGMLSNKTYIGMLVQRRFTTRNYKDRRLINLEEKDFIVACDTHTPLIPKDKFDLVQHEFKARCVLTPRDKERVYPLSGFVRCGKCNFAMNRNQTFQKGRWYVYYKCRAYSQRGKEVCNNSNYIREEKLQEAVIATINMQIKALIDIKKVVNEINLKQTNNKLQIDFAELIKQKHKAIDKYKKLKLSSYVDWKNNVLSKEEYIYTKDKLDDNINQHKSEISELETSLEADNDIKDNKIKWLDDIAKHGTIKELTREIMVTLVEMIYVTDADKVHIVFKYEDELNRLKNYINKFQNRGNSYAI